MGWVITKSGRGEGKLDSERLRVVNKTQLYTLVYLGATLGGNRNETYVRGLSKPPRSWRSWRDLRLVKNERRDDGKIRSGEDQKEENEKTEITGKWYVLDLNCKSLNI